jgi:hypothetical protein
LEGGNKIMAKKRSRSSYYGNTEEMIRRQRSNLIPGGDLYQKREISEARYNCWWEVMPLGNIQEIYELCENKRSLKDTPKKELKSEKELNSWWGKLDLEDKKYIYKTEMDAFSKETRSEIFKDIEELLKEKLAISEKG